MAKNLEIIAVFLAFSCLLSSAYCDDSPSPSPSPSTSPSPSHEEKPNNDAEGAKTDINVEGQVYCDPCRVQFPTRVSKPIKGAKVKLECRSRENATVVYTLEGETEDDGTYSLPVHKDFQEQICDVTAIHSPDEECKECFDDIERATVVITRKNGIEQKARFANPLGFMKKEASDECKEVIKELFPDEDDMPQEFKDKFNL